MDDRSAALAGLLMAIALGAGAASAGAGDVMEDFGDQANDHEWRWGTGNQAVVPLNGNPGAHVADDTLSSAMPILFTTAQESAGFTGDYRGRAVASVGVDLIVKDAAFPIGSRPLTLVLANDNGTPGFFDDDLLVWFTGDEEVPPAGEPIDPAGGAGWTPFLFDVPSGSETLPEGWEAFSPDGAPADEIWTMVITDVSSIEFWYGVPGTFYLFNSWDVGADNVSLTVGPAPGIPGDLNGDGVVDAVDLAGMLATWGRCPAPCEADLDEDGTVGPTDLATLLANWT